EHANGTDIWVVAHNWNGNGFYAWLISAAGVSTPVISNAGTVIAASSTLNIETVGCMKISPEGDRLAVANFGDYEIQLFNFDNTTGMVTNPVTVSSAYMSYGIEFSPSGNYLYAAQWNWGSNSIYQYDVNAANIAQSQTIVGTIAYPNQTAATLQRAPDCKIYMAIIGSSFLSVIQDPDLGGVACAFVANGVALGGPLSQAGLPNFIAGPCSVKNPDAIHENTTEESFPVYPNPAGDVAFIDGRKVNSDFSISCFSTLGSEVFTRNYSRNTLAEIDVSEFAPGVYFLYVESDEIAVRKTLVIR
ncbi:MAG TPA: T9SS type A sorting domain-containing protein, partial [Bacteroidia bacterium]|nr:T9SS type A sorting domain-containing protein [Bacteroidia bacterium]